MYAPALHDEPTTHAEYVRQQAEALRASVHGLTEDQARSTPCRSELSLAGLLKHVTYVYAEVADVPTPWTPEPADWEEGKAAFYGSFHPEAEETLPVLLERFDLVMGALADQMAAADPDEAQVAPPAPWVGVTQEAPVRARFHQVHVIEELARHAGHADILREQIDGATSASLLLAIWGQEGNEFVQPWRPGDAGA